LNALTQRSRSGTGTRGVGGMSNKRVTEAVAIEKCAYVQLKERTTRLGSSNREPR
jgi:hypothetical protein